MKWLDLIVEQSESPSMKSVDPIETLEREAIMSENTVAEFQTTTQEPIAESPVVHIEPQQTETFTVEIPPEIAYHHKGMRYKLVYEGVCTHCAHCGQPLTDAESSQRGIGPICSKKGYTDEVEPIDPMEAMLSLSQYPQLVDYLNAKYKPQGNRGLANGLVRTASLNRRTPVHAACTDALDALGYKKLASALRESLAVVEIYDSKAQADAYGVWVKKTDFDWNFYRALTALQGVRMTKYPVKEIVVPKVHRRALAQMILKYYEGLCVKTKGGAHKISSEWFGKSSGSPAAQA
jgi:hypothetical protein